MIHLVNIYIKVSYYNIRNKFYTFVYIYTYFRLQLRHEPSWFLGILSKWLKWCQTTKKSVVWIHLILVIDSLFGNDNNQPSFQVLKKTLKSWNMYVVIFPITWGVKWHCILYMNIYIYIDMCIYQSFRYLHSMMILQCTFY